MYEGNSKVRAIHCYYFILQHAHKNKCTVTIWSNPLVSPYACYFGLQASWCHMQRTLSVVHKATHVPCPCHDAKQLSLSASICISVNTGFQASFKQSTVPCPTDHLSMNLVLLNWETRMLA